MAALIFALVFMGGFSHASASPINAVVKITSSFTSSSVPPRRGSGVMIQFRGKPYLLTSDHVIYHSNHSFIHTMSTEDGRSQPVTYLSSDAGRGLALLGFTQPVDAKNLLSLDSPVSLPQKGEGVTLAGYPVDSDAILVDENAVLNQLQMPSRLFVEALSMIEVAGGQGEFGMSGGAAFTTNETFVGVISHQVVRDGKNSVLLLGADLVQKWLTTVMNSQGDIAKPSPIDLVQDPGQQVSEFISYRTGYLFMTFVDPFAGQGPDGIQIIFAKDAHTDSLFAGEHGPLAEIQNAKDSCHCQFRSLGFRARKILGDSANDESNPQLKLRLLLDPSIEPLWTIENNEQGKYIDQAAALKEPLQKSAQKLDFSKAPQLHYYLDKLVDRLELPPDSSDSRKSVGSWRYIKPKDLDFILDDRSLEKEWASLSNSHSQEALQFKTLVEQLRNTMRFLTL